MIYVGEKYSDYFNDGFTSQKKNYYFSNCNVNNKIIVLFSILVLNFLLFL